MIPSSYRPEQVTCLFSAYEGPLLDPTEKEDRLRSGAYYGELLAREEVPDADYLAVFDALLNRLSDRVAPVIHAVAHRIARAHAGPIALVSLARAGTPVAVVLAELLRSRFGRAVTHYSASVIHREGLDPFALRHLLNRHAPQEIVFFDGWVSQGRITRALAGTVRGIPGVDPALYCLSDPSGIQDDAGTRHDLLVPSAVLNAAVSGLLSRTVVRSDTFHAVAFFGDQAAVDRTQAFIARTLQSVLAIDPGPGEILLGSAQQSALARSQLTAWSDRWGVPSDRIKAGIGEVSRSLLRRTPDRLIIDPSAADEADHVIHLAKIRNVPYTLEPTRGPYRALSRLA